MATTRAVLRGAARRLLSPGQALGRSNELLHPELPPGMFVTCLYAVLDPPSGRLQYANAGHNLPCRCCDGGVTELRATGIPRFDAGHAARNLRPALFLVSQFCSIATVWLRLTARTERCSGSRARFDAETNLGRVDVDRGLTG